MPYLTPDSIPGDDDCRPLSIPASTDWLAIVSGALTELTKAWNWEQGGAVTVPEAVARMQQMINDYYNDPCAACTTPGGYRVIRINSDGQLEQLDDEGNWVPTTDEYHIPPPEPREGGTEEDQKCLAAKNATNVLQQLYENLSESWAAHVSEAEALTELIIAITALIGFEFAPITWAIAAFFLAVFALLYNALEYLGADLWDENFTKQMECWLFECASDVDGVVTFDWNCFNGKLNTLADSFGLSEVQLRLYIQVGYLLYFIGGVDGLNLAGRTTDITNDDCSFCECIACHEWTEIGDGSVDGNYTVRTWNNPALTPSIAMTKVILAWQLNPNPGAVLHEAHINVTLNTGDSVIDQAITDLSGSVEWDGMDNAHQLNVEVRSWFDSGGSDYPDITLLQVQYICDDEIEWSSGDDC